MKKSTLVQTAVLVITGFLAADLGIELADHNVSTGALVATIAFTISAGLLFAGQISNDLATTRYGCPTKGCAISVRHSKRGCAAGDESVRLHVLAADDSKHQPTA